MFSLSHFSLRWRHNHHDSVSNHQPHDCLLNRLFIRRSKKTSKLRVTGLCAGNSPGTGEFPAQKASNAENASIWWRHHAGTLLNLTISNGTKKRVWALPMQKWPSQLVQICQIHSCTACHQGHFIQLYMYLMMTLYHNIVWPIFNYGLPIYGDM